jgi:hypothetical protein
MAQTCLNGQNLPATADFKIGPNYVLFPKGWLHERRGHLLNTTITQYGTWGWGPRILNLGI